ncbi:MAG: acyl-CoA dehydrogenase family protein [Desulfobacterales bacterium]|nr:acyl-CoA dehydrogenase family protein [Desulfobacterales bacterium]
MDFALTEEQGFVKDTIQKFVAKECEREAIKKMDEEGIFPANLFGKVADIGLVRIDGPRGLWRRWPQYIGCGDRNGGTCGHLSCSGRNICHSKLLRGPGNCRSGHGGAKEKYLPGVIDGSALMTLALMEPEQGYEETGCPDNGQSGRRTNGSGRNKNVCAFGRSRRFYDYTRCHRKAPTAFRIS